MSVTEKEIYISELPSLPSTQRRVPARHGTKSSVLHLHSPTVWHKHIVRLSEDPLILDSLNRMQGSWSEAVDERGQSLVMDDSVGVSAPTWWRRTAVYGVADGGDCGGKGVLAPTEHEWGNGGREEGENHVFRERLSQMRGNLKT